MTGTKLKQKHRRGLIITPRDAELLREFSLMRLADREQAKIAGGFNSTTRINTRLLALVHAGLLRRFFLGAGGGRKAIYSLSAKGAQVIEAPCRGLRRRKDETVVADFFVQHQLAVNSVYCVLKFGTIPIPNIRFVNWLSFHEPIIPGLSLIPDGYVEFQTPSGLDTAFIEVDLGHEGLAIWKEKSRHYVQLALSGAYERRFKRPRFRVLVLAHSERRVHSIRTAIAQVTQKLFWLATQESAAGEKFFSTVWLRPMGDSYQPLFPEPR